jgi:hypothetical protein
MIKLLVEILLAGSLFILFIPNHQKVPTKIRKQKKQKRTSHYQQNESKKFDAWV